MQVELGDFGARILSIKVPNADGELVETTLNHLDDDEVIKDVFYLGATCGRVANRIGNARYKGPNGDVELTDNDNGNTLHGGVEGLSHRFWECGAVDKSGNTQRVCFDLLSPDGDQGFEGNLSVQVCYELDNENRLRILYSATCDKLCPINLCNHTYFHMGEDSVHQLALQVNASEYLQTSDNNIPTGDIISCSDGAYSFTEATVLREKIAIRDFDDCYVRRNVTNWQSTPFCELHSAAHNLTLSVFSDQIGLQVYTGNYLPQKYNAIALEAQGLIDAVNQENFDADWVGPNQDYHKEVVYQFKLMKTSI